jgi:glycine cleavage system protein P-like pyridoxal-binding family
LVVEEAMLIEPTETESKRTLDQFLAALEAIAGEAEREPDLLRTAPHHTPVGRLDEATAARQPVLRWGTSYAPTPRQTADGVPRWPEARPIGQSKVDR